MSVYMFALLARESGQAWRLLKGPLSLDERACPCETLFLPVEVMVGYDSTPDGVKKKKQELRACLCDGIADALIAE